MTSIHPLARRKFNTWLAGLGCLPLIAACSTKDQPITIGLHVWPGYEPTPLARAMGWLDEKLVKLVETPSATDSLKLLEQGKIDAAGLTLDEVLRARENGIALAVVLICNISAGADMLLARPNIKTLADLRGRRVGVEDGALGALMLYKALRAVGLTREDIQVVSLTVNEQAQAWKRGEIDAAITYEPDAAQIFEMGGHRLFDSRQIPDTILDVLAVRSASLEANHSKALHHLVATHLRALDYMQTRPDDAAYRMAARLKLAPDRVSTAFKGLVLPDLKNNIRLFGTPSMGLMKNAATVASTLVDAGILHKPPDLTGLLRPEFLPSEASS